MGRCRAMSRSGGCSITRQGTNPTPGHSTQPCPPSPGAPRGWHGPSRRSGFSCLCTGMIRASAAQGDGKDGESPGATGGHGGAARPRHACRRQDAGDARPGVPPVPPMHPSFPSCSATGFACKQQPPGRAFNPSPLGYYSSPANLQASPPFFLCKAPPEQRKFLSPDVM